MDDSGAATRIVPLRRLQRARSWPAADCVLERLTDARSSAVEGILARIIEAIDQSADLPIQNETFLCGMEFASLGEENRFFARHGIPLPDMEFDVVLHRGELLIFDNLAVAHGRRGVRQPGELSQLCVGYRGLDSGQQQAVITRALSAFADPV